MSFQNFNLDPKLLKAIEDSGYNEPSDIQLQAIPPILQGQDIMASAPTGTGKTAAFVLPALQRLITNAPERGIGPRVLVLTPTRELANQVAENIYKFTKYAHMSSCSVVGGTPYPPQIRMLKKPLDLLVATPGRLIDHMQSGRIDFSRLELLILDEADRMLDMGFIDDVKQIAAQTPDSRQTLLFSATLEGEIDKIARQLLKQPVRLQVSGVTVKHESITQHVHQADDYRHKRALLTHLLGKKELTQAIIFTATKKGADELAIKLKEEGLTAAALHGDMKQGMRHRTVENLKRNKIRILVATDVAARGLDVKGISHVINFDMPMQAEDYVHRIGRTGRGGSTGVAVSLVGPQDWMLLSRIEKFIDARLDLTEVEGLEPKLPKPKFGQSKPFANKRKPNVRYKKGGFKMQDQGNSRRKRRPADLRVA
ncbi:MAG: DEAD/DEAH box helicase [Gammaproteobacteria bacterium]|nr:DEAD/DEAH box helicase [Gammaproteobacteria bacterium]